MNRRPTPEEVRNAQASSDYCNGKDNTTAIDRRLALRRSGRMGAVSVLVAVAINFLMGCAIIMRDALVYRQCSHYHVAWLAQCVLAAYVVFGGMRWFNPVSVMISPHTMMAHHRKIVLLVFLKASVVGCISLGALLHRLFIQWPTSPYHRYSHGFVGAFFSIRTVCAWQITLLCALLVCLIMSEYYEALFPLTASPSPSSPPPSSVGHVGPSKSRTLPLVAAPPSPASKMPTMYYYYCPPYRKGAVEHLAFNQPAYLLLAACPLSAVEMAQLVHFMHERNAHELALMIGNDRFHERSLRRINRQLGKHVEAVRRAELALAALANVDSGDSSSTKATIQGDFLESELTRILQTHGLGMSKGVMRDLDALASAGRLDVYDRQTLDSDPLMERSRSQAIQQLMQCASALQQQEQQRHHHTTTKERYQHHIH